MRTTDNRTEVGERFEAAKVATKNALVEYDNESFKIFHVYTKGNASYLDKKYFKLKNIKTYIDKVKKKLKNNNWKLGIKVMAGGVQDNSVASWEDYSAEELSILNNVTYYANNENKKGVFPEINPSNATKRAALKKIIFDYEFYYWSYIDLREAFGYDPVALESHYNTYGKKEGRVPSLYFNPVTYLEENPDVVKALGYDYTQAYNHFIGSGFWEGRNGSIFFDAICYLENYSDLVNAFGYDYLSAISHFKTYGMREARAASDRFDVSCYMDNNLDLVRIHGYKNLLSYFIHYNDVGKKESRTCFKYDE